MNALWWRVQVNASMGIGDSDVGIKEPRARGDISCDAGESTAGGTGQGGAYTLSVDMPRCAISH